MPMRRARPVCGKQAESRAAVSGASFSTREMTRARARVSPSGGGRRARVLLDWGYPPPPISGGASMYASDSIGPDFFGCTLFISFFNGCGFLFCFVIDTRGEPVGPAQLYELENTTCRSISLQNTSTGAGSGSREPGAGAANREQTTSERRARVKDELEMSQRQHFVPTQKSLPVGRLFFLFSI